MRGLVCLPTYEERENLAPLLDEILSLTRFDIVVVDDNSPDGTGDYAQKVADSNDRVFAIQRQGPRSLAGAYVDAFRFALASDYEQIFQMDADLSHQPRYLPALSTALGSADVAVGSRYVAGGAVNQWSWQRRAVSRAGNFVAKQIMKLPLRDATSGFVGFRRQVLETVDFGSLGSEGRGFQIGLKYHAHRRGFSMLEVPIHFWDRVVGASKLTPRDAVDSFVSMVRVRAQT